jgi:hypothetical protein
MCTENAAARIAGETGGEFCWLIWSICPAVLSGIGSVCTSAASGVPPRNAGKIDRGDAGLKMSRGMSIVPV